MLGVADLGLRFPNIIWILSLNYLNPVSALPRTLVAVAEVYTYHKHKSLFQRLKNLQGD